MVVGGTSDIGVYIYGICSASVKVFCVFRYYKVSCQ